MTRRLNTIETVRLVLREIDESDAELIVHWRSVPEVYQYFKSPHRISLKEHLNWYHNIYLENPNRFDWICIEKESGNRIGVFGLYKEEKKAEVNYLLAPEGQHKGYAIEAIKSLIDYASKMWNSEQVIAEIHQDNKPSIALMDKLGFEIINQNGSFVIYGIEV